MYRLFTKHPASINTTYFAHMKRSCKFFIRLQFLAFAAIIHSVFPFLFEETASKGIKKLFENIYEEDLRSLKTKKYNSKIIVKTEKSINGHF